MTSEFPDSKSEMEDYIDGQRFLGAIIPEVNQLDVTDVTDRDALKIMARLIMNPTTVDPLSLEFPNEFGTIDRITFHGPREGEEDFPGAYVFETDHEGDEFSVVVARLISIFHSDSMEHELGEGS